MSYSSHGIVINKARQNNVIILSLPSHCTHRTQPLDISFFKSLNARYNATVQTWHRQHLGRPLTEAEFGELFNTAYSNVATLDEAHSGFRKSGICPFDRKVFTNNNFLAAEATDRPQNIDEKPGPELEASDERIAQQSSKNNVVDLQQPLIHYHLVKRKR